MKFKEPVLGLPCEFRMIERSSLRNSPYQRDLSDSLISRIVDSVDKGFLVPLIVVSVPIEDVYEIIDGQHRLGAADRHSRGETYLLPCVIVPSHLKNLPLILNVEKADNIRDKSVKIHALYMTAVEAHPDDWTEQKLITAVGYQPYLFTMAFGYKEALIDSPSLVEPLVKKLDKVTLEEALTITVEIRRSRGILAKAVEVVINEAAEKYGIKDFNLKKSILSQSSMELWGRKRNIGVNFQEGVEQIVEVIQSTSWHGMQKM